MKEKEKGGQLGADRGGQFSADSPFKGDQEAIITHLVEGKNAFVLMPTGGGWYFKDDEKKTMILYGGSGDFGRADLAFLNRIPRELRDYAFIYQPSLGLPGNELDLTDVEWF